MKKFFSTLFIACLSLSFAACSDDDEPTPPIQQSNSPHSIVLRVVDQDGNDLLDKNNPDNILSAPISVTYLGVTSTPVEWQARPSEVIPGNVDWYGAMIFQIDQGFDWCGISIGNIVQYGSHEIILTIDGREYLIEAEITPNDYYGPDYSSMEYTINHQSTTERYPKIVFTKE